MLLHVEPLSSWTSYMLLITVSSKPQLNAVLARMEKEAEAVWHRPRTHRSPGRCVLLQLLWLLDSSASALLSNGYHGTTHWQLLEVLLLVYEHLWAIEAAACKVSCHAGDSFPGIYLLRVQMLSWSELSSFSLKYPRLLHSSGVLNRKTRILSAVGDGRCLTLETWWYMSCLKRCAAIMTWKASTAQLRR